MKTAKNSRIVMWIVCLSIIVTVFSPAGAAINDPIKEVNIKATATYTTPCNGNTDRVRVKNAGKIKGTRWEFKDATKDTARIEVHGDTLQESGLWKTTFDIENRGGIGATYVLIGEYKEGGGAPGAPGGGWKAYAKDRDPSAGDLIVMCLNTGYSIANGGDESKITLICGLPSVSLGTENRDKGDVRFKLENQEGGTTFTWTVTPGTHSGQLTNSTTPAYQDEIENLAPGVYTLNVKQGETLVRQQKFTIPKCYATAARKNRPGSQADDNNQIKWARATGHAAVQVNTGKELLDKLAAWSENDNAVGRWYHFGHGSMGSWKGMVMNWNAGLYLVTPGRPNETYTADARNIANLQAAVNDGIIVFAPKYEMRGHYCFPGQNGFGQALSQATLGRVYASKGLSAMQSPANGPPPALGVDVGWVSGDGGHRVYLRGEEVANPANGDADLKIWFAGTGTSLLRMYYDANYNNFPN